MAVKPGAIDANGHQFINCFDKIASSSDCHVHTKFESSCPEELNRAGNAFVGAVAAGVRPRKIIDLLLTIDAKANVKMELFNKVKPPLI